MTLAETLPKPAKRAEKTRAPHPDAQPAQKVVLNVGCGAPQSAELPDSFFPVTMWRELPLDSGAAHGSDVTGSITELPMVADGSVDAVWSSGDLKHLVANDVSLALAEFRRVLRPGGFALLTVPDLQSVAALIAEDRLEDAAYVSSAGPITPLDMLFGYRPVMTATDPRSVHRTGFTAGTLDAHLRRAGFADVQVLRDGGFTLWAKAIRGA